MLWAEKSGRGDLGESLRADLFLINFPASYENGKLEHFLHRWMKQRRKKRAMERKKKRSNSNRVNERMRGKKEEEEATERMREKKNSGGERKN